MPDKVIDEFAEILSKTKSSWSPVWVSIPGHSTPSPTLEIHQARAIRNYVNERDGRHLIYAQEYGKDIGRAEYALEHGIVDEHLYLYNRSYQHGVENFICALCLILVRSL